VTHPTLDTVMDQASAATRRLNTPRRATPDTQARADGGRAVSEIGQATKRVETATEGETYRAVQSAQKYGKCPHTGRPYRSKTEARWASEHRQHWYEPLTFWTPCGRYTPDFACGPILYEVKGGWIRDRALHKVKAALRVVKEFGFDGIWLAQWDGKRWDVTEIAEG
jgi:hypothetical protein